MSPRRWTTTILFLFSFFLLLTPVRPAQAQSYEELRHEIREKKLEFAKRVGENPTEDEQKHVRDAIRRSVEDLIDAWEGTKWGLGSPQTQTPGEGKINCGMFVGTVLKHAGFEIDHGKLQRQPSELIVKTLAPKKLIRRFRNTPMPKFLEGVRELGPGLFVVGLDYHVGFLAVQPDGEVRFIHAGLFSKVVADQDPRNAPELTESRYRVVGKILQENMLRAWIRSSAIEVKGDW